MAFKSKTDFNSFDKNNSKVKNLDLSKVKSVTKAGVKKLINVEEKTPYHLVLDYFVDKVGKTIGPFIDFGENKKLTKHFEQVEMKPGKLDKSMSDTPKKACAGMAYVKVVDGKKVVHLEPKDISKIPNGQWPRILKSLKPFFGGLTAVVVLAGDVIQATKDSEATATETQTEPVTEEKSTAEKIKNLVLSITTTLKEGLPNVVMPNIKSKTVSQNDLDITSKLLEDIEDLKIVYGEAEAGIKAKIEKHYNSILKQVSKLEKVQTAIENLLGITEMALDVLEPNEDDSVEVKALKELLANLTEETGLISKEFDKAAAEIAETSSSIIEEGDALLDALFN